MLSDILDDAIAELKTLPEFADGPDKKVFRGEVGKSNIITSDGCIVMPEFQPPKMFGEQDDNEKDKLLKFTPNFFIISGKRKTLEENENNCMNLMFKVLQKLSRKEFSVDMGGQKTFQHLEFTDIDWLERSASLCVIALEFTVKLQV